MWCCCVYRYDAVSFDLAFQSCSKFFQPTRLLSSYCHDRSFKRESEEQRRKEQSERFNEKEID